MLRGVGVQVIVERHRTENWVSGTINRMTHPNLKDSKTPPVYEYYPENTHQAPWCWSVNYCPEPLWLLRNNDWHQYSPPHHQSLTKFAEQ